MASVIVHHILFEDFVILCFKVVNVMILFCENALRSNYGSLKQNNSYIFWLKIIQSAYGPEWIQNTHNG